MKEIPENKIEVTELPIKLGQFLKLANLVQDGLEAKFYIQDGQVYVNGNIEKRRGKKLQNGDIVNLHQHVCVVSESS